ncbi:MAG: hypothetical protein HEP71_02455 [Roseivirga sp.]|nr:hypothetical protein [Roseivirga sp.]
MSSVFVLLIFLAHLLLFSLFYFLLLKFFKHQKWFQKAGKKLLETKEHQLKTNGLLKRFSRAVDSGNIWKARLIIGCLIFVKSVGMTAIGLVGFSLIMVLIQAIMTAAIFEQVRLRGISAQGFLKTLSFQLIAMLSAAVVGNLLGWRMFIDELSLNHALVSESYIILTLSLIVVFFCWLAAKTEVRFYQENKTLIG